MTTTPDLLPWPNKSPSEQFPVDVDWSKLGGEDAVIESVTVEVLTGTVAVDQPEPTDEATDLDGLTQTVWLSGGEIGEYATFCCTVNFTDQRTFSQAYYLFVR